MRFPTGRAVTWMNIISWFLTDPETRIWRGRMEAWLGCGRWRIDGYCRWALRCGGAMSDISRPVRGNTAEMRGHSQIFPFLLFNIEVGPTFPLRRNPNPLYPI
jgi:hypothetical protein